MKYSEKIIIRHLDYFIHEMGEVGFLKEIKPAGGKPVIVQVNRNKVKDVKEWAGKINSGDGVGDIGMESNRSNNDVVI
jgi:hypothetical protein